METVENTTEAVNSLRNVQTLWFQACILKKLDFNYEYL